MHVDSTLVYMQNTGEKYQSHSNKERKLDKLQICQARILYPEVTFFSLKVKKDFLGQTEAEKNHHLQNCTTRNVTEVVLCAEGI